MEQFFPREINLHFNLRKPKSDRPTMIFLVVYVKGKQYKFSTGVKVYPSQWNKKHEMAVESWKLNEIDNTNNHIVNEKIKSIKFGFEKLFPHLCSGDDVVTTLNSISIIMRQKTTINIPNDLFCCIANDLSIKASTRKTDCTAVRHLANFLDSDDAKKFKIKNYKDLAKTEVFKAIRKSIAKLPRIEGGAIPEDVHRVEYVNKILKKIKTLLKKYAVQDKAGYLTLTDINNLNLTPLLQKDESHTDNKVYLTDKEVTSLYNYKCNNDKDEAIKDLFLLECGTGLRVGDALRLCDDKHVTYCEDGRVMIDIVTRKTMERVQFYVYFDIARQILIKYKGKSFPKVDMGDYNRRIKKICRECGMTELCEQVKHYDGEDKARSEKVEKCELISSHTGRHTFIVLMMLRGIGIEDIQKYTGHRTYDMVLDYSKRMKMADKEDFQELKKSHPEQVVLTCEEADKGGLATPIKPSNTSNLPNTDFLHEYIQLHNEKNGLKEMQELKNLLNILGVNPHKTAMTDDRIELEMMLYDRVGKLGKAGANVRLTKELWNSEALEYREKCQQIIDIVSRTIGPNYA